MFHCDCSVAFYQSYINAIRIFIYVTFWRNNVPFFISERQCVESKLSETIRLSFFPVWLSSGLITKRRLPSHRVGLLVTPRADPWTLELPGNIWGRLWDTLISSCRRDVSWLRWHVPGCRTEPAIRLIVASFHSTDSCSYGSTCHTTRRCSCLRSCLGFYSRVNLCGLPALGKSVLVLQPNTSVPEIGTPYCCLCDCVDAVVWLFRT